MRPACAADVRRGETKLMIGTEVDNRSSRS
jgi:hypothetical protein